MMRFLTLFFEEQPAPFAGAQTKTFIQRLHVRTALCSCKNTHLNEQKRVCFRLTSERCSRLRDEKYLPCLTQTQSKISVS